MNRSRTRSLFALLVIACLAACQPGEPAESLASTSPDGWDGFVADFVEEFFRSHPAFAVGQGRHEYDGQLPDWSREGIEREIARLHRSRDEAMAFAADDLSHEQLYQREYLLSRIDHDLFWVEKAEWPFRNPQFYLGWLNDSVDPSPYITLSYAPVEQRMQAFTLYLRNLPVAVAQIRDNLRMPMASTWLEYGIDSFQGYAARTSTRARASFSRWVILMSAVLGSGKPEG